MLAGRGAPGEGTCIIFAFVADLVDDSAEGWTSLGVGGKVDDSIK